MTRPLASLLKELLAGVAEDCPEAITAIVEQARGLSVTAQIDDETLTLAVGATGPVVVAEGVGAVRVEASGTCLRALILGDRSILATVVEEELRIWGGVFDLARLDDLVQCLVAGAARTRSAGSLFEEFLAKVVTREQ